MAFTQGDDINILQATDIGTVGAGGGDDTYILSAFTLNADQKLTISDGEGINTLQLIQGLEILSSLVTNDAVQLKLSNGAEITLMGASSFMFSVAGNVLTGVSGVVQNFSTFVTESLGLDSVPTTSTPVAGGAVSITATGAVPEVDPAEGAIVIAVGINTVEGTVEADRFYFDVEGALADLTGTKSQSTILNFDVTQDRLVLDVAVADSTITTLEQLNGYEGISVQMNPFNQSFLVNFGNDANGGDVVSLDLVGVDSMASVVVELV